MRSVCLPFPLCVRGLRLERLSNLPEVIQLANDGARLYLPAGFMILDSQFWCLLLTWAETLGFALLLWLTCIPGKPQFLVLCTAQCRPLYRLAGSWEFTCCCTVSRAAGSAPEVSGRQIQAMECVPLDSNCGPKVNYTLLETSSNPGFLQVIFKAGLCWENRRDKLVSLSCADGTARHVLWVTATSKKHIPVTSSLRLGRLVESFISLWGAPREPGPEMKMVWSLPSRNSSILIIRSKTWHHSIRMLEASRAMAVQSS